MRSRKSGFLIPSFLLFAFVFLGQAKYGYADNVTLAWDPITQPQLAGYKVYVGSAPRSYGQGIDVGKATTYTFTGLGAGTYYFAVTAYDINGLETGYSNEASTTLSSADTSPPGVSITSPTSSAVYGTGVNLLGLGGTASDNVAVTQVTWVNNRGGSGTASGTSSWSVAGIALQVGTNVITVTARDAAGNTGSGSLTVTFTPPDITPPAVSITSPTSSATYNTGSNTLGIAGTASDNSVVTQVSWSNNRGGSGTASGTSSWSVAGIALQVGTNVITVTARDAAGNTGSGSLTVTFTPPDITPPAVSITSPTSSATYNTGSNTLGIAGTASDNSVVTQVSWSNNRGGSGTANGTSSWSVAGITLQSGTNVITVTARDGVGNASTATLTVTYTPPDTTPPAVSISSPTSSPTYSTGSSSLNVGGTAADNVAVTQVIWVNNLGGSGTATGTSSWSVSGLALQSGTNVITVTARDAAGNTGYATLTVTYTPPDTTPPAVSITSPTSSPTYSTVSSALSFGGTASDNVAITQVTWTNNLGGSGTANGTSSWSVAGITLQSGANVITVTARDAAGNTGSATLTVTYTPPDTTAPTVSITSPTSGPTYGTGSSSLGIGGTAADNVTVTQVTWANNRGGSGAANGTTSWSVAGITLQSGTNVITVTARDTAGNASVAALTVTYTPPDTTPPAVSITSPGVSSSSLTPTSSFTAVSSPISIAGSASDDVAVTQVTWANDRGGTGTASGTSSWSVAEITLQSGTNVITVTARDAAGNTGAATLAVTYTAPDTTPPVISNVSASGVTDTSVSISWKTNEASDAQVEYGTSTIYGNLATLDPSMLTSHVQGLSSLTPGTLYHYRVRSTDGAGNLAISGDFNFTTQTPCRYSLSSNSISVNSSDAKGNVKVYAASGCTWSATSNAAWLTITSGSTGSGNGSFSYAVAPNTFTSLRSGSLSVADQLFKVFQAPPKAIFDINVDGVVDTLDLQILSNVIQGVSTCPTICDMNGDSKVNARDLQSLINVILGK